MDPDMDGFGLFVQTEGEALHLGQITAALLRRHGLADLDEMLEHLRLALGAERAKFGQFLLGDRIDVGWPFNAVSSSDFLAAIFAHISAHFGR